MAMNYPCIYSAQTWFLLEGDFNSFSNLRPISLSNFTSKRLVHLLSNLFSPQQAGFVKGRNIVEKYIICTGDCPWYEIEG